MAEGSNLERYLETVQATADNLDKQLRPLAHLQEAVLSSVPLATAKAVESLTAIAAMKPSPAVEALRMSIEAQQQAAAGLRRHLTSVDWTPMLSSFAEAAVRLQRDFEPMLEMTRGLQEAAKAFASSLDWSAISKSALQFSEFVVQIEQGAKTLPERTRKAVAALSRHGWFFDLDMPVASLWKLEKAIEEGNIEEAEAALCSYYSQKAAGIVEKLKQRFPSRAKVLASALGAHQRGEYNLSVPVFLTQTDGICQEVVRVQLCKIRYQKEEVTARVEKAVGDAVWAALLHPLTDPSPLSLNERERGPDFVGLNRHLVLHGQSTDYGTEKNSLRAIALINYVATVFEKQETGAAA